MELRHSHLSHQVAALELHQPGILQGVCAQWPIQLRKHCMTPKLEAGEEEIGLLQMFFSSLSPDQVGGCEQNWREKQLKPSLPISLVHLKHQLLYGEVGARGVLLRTIANKICLQVVNSYVQSNIEGAVVTEVDWSRFFCIVLLKFAVFCLVHCSVLLVLAKQVLFHMHEVPDERPIQECYAWTNLRQQFQSRLMEH